MQGQSAGMGGGNSAGRGQMDQTRDRSQDVVRDQSQDKLQDQTRLTQRDQLHTQVSTEQRDQYRTCDQSAEQTRATARTLARSAGNGLFNTDDLRDKHQQLKQQFQTLQQNREQLNTGLSVEQQSAVEKRNQEMQKTHERIQSRLQEMDRELSGSTFNATNFAAQARATERDMNSYQKQLRATGRTLDLLND